MRRQLLLLAWTDRQAGSSQGRCKTGQGRWAVGQGKRVAPCIRAGQVTCQKLILTHVTPMWISGHQKFTPRSLHTQSDLQDSPTTVKQLLLLLLLLIVLSKAASTAVSVSKQVCLLNLVQGNHGLPVHSCIRRKQALCQKCKWCRLQNKAARLHLTPCHAWSLGSISQEACGQAQVVKRRAFLHPRRYWYLQFLTCKQL